jgi:hypothetical protein
VADPAENLATLADLPGQWIDKVHQRRPPRIVVLEDSSESPTYGEREGSAYNGHFGCTCYHPLFVFNQLGDLERCALRSGNVHSAASWREVLEPVVARYRGTVERCCFRGDAAFANSKIYEFLEAEGMGYAISTEFARDFDDAHHLSLDCREPRLDRARSLSLEALGHPCEHVAERQQGGRKSKSHHDESPRT